MSTAINEKSELILIPDQQKMLQDIAVRVLSIVISTYNNYIPQGNVDPNQKQRVLEILTGEHGDIYLTALIQNLFFILYENGSHRQYYMIMEQAFAQYQQYLNTNPASNGAGEATVPLAINKSIIPPSNEQVQNTTSEKTQ